MVSVNQSIEQFTTCTPIYWDLSDGDARSDY
jgi:hypothetical protein